MHNSYDDSLKSKYLVDEWKERDDRVGIPGPEMNSSYYRNMRLKQDIPEEEHNLLLKKVKVDDGTMAEAVTCYKSLNMWRYICHPCNVNVPRSEFKTHVQGRRHRTTFSKHCHPRDNFLNREEIVRRANLEMAYNQMFVINHNCKINKILDDCKKPLIGLEYLLEVCSERTVDLEYYCLFCSSNTTVSPIDHLTSQSHQTKYLTKFFPTAAKKLDLYNKFGFRKNDEVFNMLTEHVVARIEHRLGRMKPMQVPDNILEFTKNSLRNKVEGGGHLMETSTDSFVECVDIAHLNPQYCPVGWLGKFFSPPREKNSGKIQPLMETVVEPPSIVGKDSRDMRGDDHHSVRKDQGRDLKDPVLDNYKYERTTGSSDRIRSANVDRSRYTKEYQTDPGNSLEPPAVSYNRWEEEERRFYEYTCSSADTNLWKNYLDRVQLIETNLLEEMRYYQETPEKHPKYEEEWRVYWKRRNEELISMGEDPRNYDITVEWNAFWEIRLNDLFKEIFEKEKAQLRQQLQFLQIDTSKVVDNSSWNENFDYKRSESLKRQFDSRDRSKSDLPEKRKKSSYEERGPSSKQSSNVPVIPVLRKLSVLEHNLGSLGPKVVDLLSTALTLEKTTEKGADSILLSEENCVLLETVKEKLKGFLQSGLLQETMVTVTEAAINSLIELLNSVPKKDKLSTLRDRRSSSQVKKSYSNERKQFSNEKRPRSTDRRPQSSERRPRSNERRPRSNERRPRSNERRPRSNERRPRSNERRLRSKERRPRSNERRPRSNERRPRSKERKPRSNVRKPRSKERKPNSRERVPRSSERKPNSRGRKPNSRERKPNSRERRPRSSEKKLRSQERQFRANEKKNHSNEQPPLDERRLRSNDNGPHTKQRRLQSTERYPQTHQRPVYEAFHSEGLEVFMSDSRNQPQNFLTSRSLNVSEINVYVEKLGILSQLTFLQRTAISQQIGSLLLLRGVRTITEDELLLLIKTLIPGSAQSNIFQGIAQTGNLQFAAPSTSGRTDKGTTRPVLLETPNYPPSANYVTNQSIYSTYGQASKIPGSGGKNMVYSSQQLTKYSNSSAVTYPLNANPYKTGDRRKY